MFGGGGEDDTITFGVTASLSGALSGAGTRYLHGFEIWRDLVNENGGLLDREVELIHYDDESNPERSLTLYNRLVDQDDVDLLFGPYASPLNYSAANASAQYNIPMVTGAASDPGLYDRGFEYFYSTQSKTTKYGRAFPRYLGETVDWGSYDISEPETAAVIYTEGAFTTDIGESAIGNLEEFGYEVTYEEQHPMDVSDYSNIITRIDEADPPRDRQQQERVGERNRQQECDDPARSHTPPFATAVHSPCVVRREHRISGERHLEGLTRRRDRSRV
jgi:branched-chain amino acid transport system substrate-binding protein